MKSPNMIIASAYTKTFEKMVDPVGSTISQVQ